MVKLFASEMSERVTSEALQILGGGWLHHTQSGRAALARCAADEDFRGNVGNPDAHHFRPHSRTRLNRPV